MYPFKYSVALRIFHPRVDPADITQALGIEPTRSWRAGDPRRTPQGDELNGTYPESYWYCDFEQPKQKRLQLGEFLADVVGRLARHRDFFQEIVSEDGGVELYVAWKTPSNSGATLSSGLLRMFAALRLSLALDIYAVKERKTTVRKPGPASTGKG